MENVQVAKSEASEKKSEKSKSLWQHAFDTLKRDLLDIGFKSVERYNWKDTEHFYVDDYSQAYLPHMDKANGLLMSLNVEATK